MDSGRPRGEFSTDSRGKRRGCSFLPEVEREAGRVFHIVTPLVVDGHDMAHVTTQGNEIVMEILRPDSVLRHPLVAPLQARVVVGAASPCSEERDEVGLRRDVIEGIESITENRQIAPVLCRRGGYEANGGLAPRLGRKSCPSLRPAAAGAVFRWERPSKVSPPAKGETVNVFGLITARPGVVAVSSNPAEKKKQTSFHTDSSLG